MSGAKAQVVNLSDAEQQGLEKLIKRHHVGQQIALRARIILAAANEQKNKEIAHAYNVTLDTVGCGAIVGSSCKTSRLMI